LPSAKGDGRDHKGGCHFLQPGANSLQVSDDVHRTMEELAADMPEGGGICRCHHLRHRFAVEYLRAGGNIYQLQKILGHSSIKTTEIYLNYLTPDEAFQAQHGDREIVKLGTQVGTQ